MIDLAIIGGGPAGTAAALEARRRGFEVVVFEKQRFPHDKVCGEFVSAESVSFLESVIPTTMAHAARIDCTRFTSRRGRLHGFSLPAAARGLSRRSLDDALWKAAARAGATVQDGTAVRRVRRLTREAGCNWEIESRSPTVRARALIVACGRWWKIEGLESPAVNQQKSRSGDWLGVKAHFRSMAARGAVEMFYFPGGYCGVAPVEDGLHNACCLVHRSLARRHTASSMPDFHAWICAVARHPMLDERLREGTQAGETVTTAPVRLARRCAARDDVLFAGDAAGFLDPFTGDGISMALNSGRLAAEELTKADLASAHGFREAGRTYERRLAESVRRSYTVASILRGLVRAPDLIQDFTAGVISLFGPRLHAETRWKTSRGAAESASSA